MSRSPSGALVSAAKPAFPLTLHLSVLSTHFHRPPLSRLRSRGSSEGVSGGVILLSQHLKIL